MYTHCVSVSKKWDCSLHTKIIRLQYIPNKNLYICNVRCARKIAQAFGLSRWFFCFYLFFSSRRLKDMFIHLSISVSLFSFLFFHMACAMCTLNLVTPVKNSLWLNNFHKLRIGIAFDLRCVLYMAKTGCCLHFSKFQNSMFSSSVCVFPFVNIIQFN